MQLLKEYKWWIVLIVILFASVYFIKSFIWAKKNTDHENIISNWEERNDKILDLLSFYKSIGTEKLSTEKLNALQTKLKEAHCSSISKVDLYYKIEYKNDDIYGISFYYNIFDKPIADSMIKALGWVPCTHRYFKPDVVLEMHGGALGAECWKDYLKNLNSL